MGRKTPHHAACACGWQVKRMRANSPDTQQQKCTFKSVRMFPFNHPLQQHPFPKIALQSRLNTEIFDTLIDKRSLPHQHYASFHREQKRLFGIEDLSSFLRNTSKEVEPLWERSLELYSVGCFILSNYVPETFIFLFTANACAGLHTSVNTKVLLSQTKPTFCAQSF